MGECPPSESCQLVLPILRVPQLRDVHAGVIAFPGVVRRVTNTVLAAGFGDLRSGFDFFEETSGAFFAEHRLFQTERL